jgi:hypothetical protein
MEKDLEIIKKILKDLEFADGFISVLIKHLTDQLEDSKFNRFTPNFLYTHSAFEIGRNNARELAEYFEEYLNTGSYETRMQKFLNNSKWMK